MHPAPWDVTDLSLSLLPDQHTDLISVSYHKNSFPSELQASPAATGPFPDCFSRTKLLQSPHLLFVLPLPSDSAQ